MVEVTQIVRDAVADYMALISAMKGKYDPVAMAFMDPICDDMPITQAFAAIHQAGIAEGRRQMREEAATVAEYYPSPLNDLPMAMAIKGVVMAIRAIPIGDE